MRKKFVPKMAPVDYAVLSWIKQKMGKRVFDSIHVMSFFGNPDNSYRNSAAISKKVCAQLIAHGYATKDEVGWLTLTDKQPETQEPA